MNKEQPEGYEFEREKLKRKYDKKKTPICLLQLGAFNPPTFMHFRLFENARDILESKHNYEVIGGFSSPACDGYKKAGLVHSKHRIKMVEIALKDSWVQVDHWQALQPNFVVTLTVLRHLENQIKKAKIYDEETLKKMQISPLCGADLVRRFRNPVYDPKDVETIVRDYGLIVSERKGVDLEKEIEEQPILKKWKKNIIVIPSFIENEVSSTKVRELIKKNFSTKYYIEEEVRKYIDEHKLYRE